MHHKNRIIIVGGYSTEELQVLLWTCLYASLLISLKKNHVGHTKAAELEMTTATDSDITEHIVVC